MSSTESIPTTTSHYEVSKSEKDDLVLSNLSFVFTALILLVIIIQKYLKNHNLDSYLIFIFIFTLLTMFISIFYHDCQTYKDKNVAFEDDEKRGKKCSRFSNQGVQFTQMYYIDLLFALMSVYGIFLFLIPLTNLNRFILFLYTFIYVAIALIFRGEGSDRFTNFVIAAIPVGLVMILYFINPIFNKLYGDKKYEYLIHKILFGKNKYKYTHIFYGESNNNKYAIYFNIFFLLAGLGCMGASSLFFTKKNVEDYHKNHSMWHILGGLSGVFFLLSSYPEIIED